MHKLALCWLLLLPPGLCCASEVIQMKTVGRGSDTTPLCSNTTEHIIIFILCEVHTERTGGGCLLLYEHGKGFENRCDPRFTLMTENHTVFLHLTSLTPVDSGNYTCQCSHTGGTDILRLSITVEEERETNISTYWIILTAVIAVSVAVTVTVTGVIFGLICICKRKRHGHVLRAATSGFPVSETPVSLDKGDDDDLYTSLRQPDIEVYQTVSPSSSNMRNIGSDDQKIDQSCEDIYEN